MISSGKKRGCLLGRGASVSNVRQAQSAWGNQRRPARPEWPEGMWTWEGRK